MTLFRSRTSLQCISAQHLTLLKSKKPNILLLTTLFLSAGFTFAVFGALMISRYNLIGFSGYLSDRKTSAVSDSNSNSAAKNTIQRTPEESCKNNKVKIADSELLRS